MDANRWLCLICWEQRILIRSILLATGNHLLLFPGPGSGSDLIPALRVDIPQDTAKGTELANCKSIIILSEKSSGSSSCQNLLAKFADIQHVKRTRHYQNETLYWTKAASVLNLPQVDMVDSEVPLSGKKARQDLLELLQQNVDFPTPTGPDQAWIMEGWRRLCQEYSPIFLEKSPHHLCQWSALELIIKCIDSLPEIDFLLIGLIRNPMDTIYSQYTRWKSPPRMIEKQWCVAYENLLRLKEIAGEKLVVVRYEDMVSSLKYMEPVFRFIGVTADAADSTYLHQRSLQKWKYDSLFGFTLSRETLDLAQQFGYKVDELSNSSYYFWPLVQRARRMVYLVARPITKVARNKLAGVIHHSRP